MSKMTNRQIRKLQPLFRTEYQLLKYNRKIKGSKDILIRRQ